MAKLILEIDAKVKEDFEGLCEKLELNPTIVLNTFIKRMCSEKKIPLNVSEYKKMK